MSRGLGIREREVRDAVAAGSFTLRRIIASYHEIPVSEALYRSYARAARSLVRKGIISDMGTGWHGAPGERQYCLPDDAEGYADRVRRAFGSEWRPGRALSSN